MLVRILIYRTTGLFVTDLQDLLLSLISLSYYDTWKLVVEVIERNCGLHDW